MAVPERRFAAFLGAASPPEQDTVLSTWLGSLPLGAVPCRQACGKFAMHMYLERLSISLLVCLAPLSGCGDDTAGGTESATDTTSPTTAAETTESPSTTEEPTGSMSETTTVGESSDSESDSESDTTETTEGPMCDPQLDDGDICKMDCECFSGSCYLVPLIGGSCGECKVDADCPNGGCTLPNPYGMVGASCNNGEPGKGCETDEVCSDPDNAICGTILEAAGILAIKTCGECATDADCGGATPHCAPDLDVGMFTGILSCKADAAVAQDGACQKPGQLDAVCMSGMCSAANVMGVIDVGICGECLGDDDCQPGQTCVDAEIDLMGGDLDALTGSFCE